MDYVYIRLLMEYSDKRFPFEKAKGDPGLSEGLRSVNKFLQNNGSRRLSGGDMNRIMLNERQVKKQVRDIDEKYIPKPSQERDKE